ncbi:MAG: amidohydrolase family protein [Gaiellales bacterium]
MIIENGVIRTMDPSLPTVRALAIAADRIVGGVGTHEWALPTPDVVDLRGRCAIPGLVDAHVHFPTWALARQQLRLEGCGSLAELLELVREAAAAAPRGRWLIGRGWRSGDWPDGTDPSRYDLDAVAGDLPVALWARDEHSLVLSSAGLARGSGDLTVSGGVVETGPDGEPTGVLREEAAWRFRERFIAAGEDEYVEAVRAGIRVAHARGVTGVHDKDGRIGSVGIWERVRALAGPMVRVRQSLPLEQLRELESLRLRSGIGDDVFRIGYLKTFMDGTLGSQTAWMLDGSGVAITSCEQLADAIHRAARAGWPLAVHAIGDAANRAALDAFASTRDDWHPRGLRPRIEHAQLVDPADLPRFAALGVAASVQFSHAPSDRELADRLWGDRLAGAYAYRSLVDSGAVVANGSDAPIEELDPLAGLRAGVLRTLDERPPWQPAQALPVEQALAAATVAPAWLSHDEKRLGRLVPGFLADLVVLDRDPIACGRDGLEELSVVATMVGGRWVHNPPPWD